MSITLNNVAQWGTGEEHLDFGVLPIQGSVDSCALDCRVTLHQAHDLSESCYLTCKMGVKIAITSCISLLGL